MHAIVPLADGFEEIEAITIIDLLRRGGIDVTVAGVSGLGATGSHDIHVRCETPLSACDFDAADALVLPGGMPGSRALRDNPVIRDAVVRMTGQGKLVAAICAAPTVLESCGVLAGRSATSHPAHAHEMNNCTYLEEPVVEDGNIITSRGAGTAIEFGFAVVKRLAGEEVARDILARIQFRG